MKNDILEKELIESNVIKYIASVNNSIITLNWFEDFPKFKTSSPDTYPFIYVINRSDFELVKNLRLTYIKKGEVKINFDEPVEGVNILLFF